MSDIAGVLLPLSVLVDMAGRSQNIDAQSGRPALTWGVDASSSTGVEAGNGVVQVVSWANDGARLEMFCGLLFDQIHVIRPVYNAGFVISSMVWSVEVWNAHTGEQKTLSSLAVSGTGGLQVSGPLSSGGVLGAMDSVIYTAMLDADGPTTVANIATWTFAGETASTLTVTGSRLTTFSVEIDWTDGFEEVMEYATNILAAHSSKEQRIQLRTTPRYSAAFKVSTLTQRDTAHFEAMVAGWQSRQYGVPWWMDASPLNAPASIGDVVIQVDTALRHGFEIGGLVMIWRDQYTYEALVIESMTATSITLASQMTMAWSAGAMVVPLRRGRLDDAVSIKRETSGIATASASFTCEVV